jgi:UDP-glucose 4-epimerase
VKAVITGGSGFIGSHIVDVLVERGHSVTNIDLKAPCRFDVEHLQGSILDRGLLERAVRGSDVVFHIGGFSNIDYVKDNPVETIELNVLSTTYLLDVCRRYNNPRFVYASSVYAFDRSGHLYTTSKACSERIIEDFSTLYGIPYTTLRYATAYGPRSREADVVFLFIKSALTKNEIEIHGDGNQMRNLIHVRDIAVASVLAMEREECRNKTLTIAAKRALSINELAIKIKRIINSDCRIVYKGAQRVQDYRGEIEDVRHAYELLKWEPRMDIEHGIRELAGLI